MARDGRYRLVIVDDDPAFAAALTAVVAAGGLFEVVGYAPDGVHACSLVEEARPDVVTMDLDMPLLDGVEATRQVAPLVPVVLVTGSGSRQRVGEALDAGAVDYVPKARIAEELVDVLVAAAALRASAAA